MAPSDVIVHTPAERWKFYQAYYKKQCKWSATGQAWKTEILVWNSEDERPLSH